MEKLVVVGLLFKDEKILINQRKINQDLAGFWEFPGGKVEENERLEEALKREFFEEFNLTIQPENLVFTKKFDYAKNKVSLFFYLCRLIDGADPVAKEGHDWCWCKVEDLKKYEFLPANEELIQLLINNQLL